MAQAALPLLRVEIHSARARHASLLAWFSQLGVCDRILVAGAALIVFQLVRAAVRFPHWAWMIR